MKRIVLLGTVAALLVAVEVTAAGGRGLLFQAIFHSAGTGAADRSAFAKLGDVLSVKDFGAMGDGVTNDTAAIQAAITAGCAQNHEIYVPGGTYMITPAAAQTDEAGTNTAAFLMCSNMHIRADRAATFKIADSVSTDASPKRFSMFFSNQFLHDISIRNLTMDMNGANNKISPSRASCSYNLYTQAAVIFSGTPGGIAAGANDVLLEHNQFLNTAGVSSIVMAQSNTVGTTLGVRWTLRNNKFWNNGLDTSDHSSVFGWAEDVLVEGNIFGADTMAQTVSVTGCNVAYEVHGAKTRFINNKISNCYQGAWAGTNYTNPVTDVIFQGNTMSPLLGLGISFFRNTTNEPALQKVVIEGNTIHVNDTAALNQGTCIATGGFIKAGVLIPAKYTVTDVLITNNKMTKDITGTTQGAAFVSITPQTVAGEKPDNIVVRGNHALNTTFGVLLTPNATNGLGHIEVSDNTWVDLTPSTSFTNPVGVFLNGNGLPAVTELVLGGNNSIDTRGVPLFQYGTYLSGTVTTLITAPQFAKGLTVSDHTEASFTATTRKASQTPSGIQLGPVTFANLGTPANLTVIGCSDCTIANPCAGGGTGAIAKRLNGIWVCN